MSSDTLSALQSTAVVVSLLVLAVLAAWWGERHMENGEANDER